MTHTFRPQPCRSSARVVPVIALLALGGTVGGPAAGAQQQDAGLEGLPVISITVEGLEHVDEDVVRRRLQLHEGAPWHAAIARRDERAVSALALFWTVRVRGERSSAPGGAEGVAVRVRVEERFAWFVVPQVDWTQEEGWSFGLSAGHLNVGGRGHRLFATAMAGAKRYLSVSLQNPWAGDRHQAFAFGGAVLKARNLLYDFTESGARATAEWSRWFAGPGRLAVGIRYQHVRSDRPGITLSSASQDRLHLAWAYLGLDTTDPWAYPQLGLVGGLTAEAYGGLLGGDLDGSAYTASASLHLPLGHNLVWASMGRLSSARGDVPYWRLLALGGAYTVRGYPLGSYLVRRRWDASAELQWYAVPMRTHDLGALGEQILGLSFSVMVDAGAGRDVRRGPGSGPWGRNTPLLHSLGVGTTLHNAMFGNLRVEIAWPERGSGVVIFRIGSKL